MFKIPQYLKNSWEDTLILFSKVGKYPGNGNQVKLYEVSIPVVLNGTTIYKDLFFQGSSSPTRAHIITTLETELGYDDEKEKDPIISAALEYVKGCPDNFEMEQDQIYLLIEKVIVMRHDVYKT